MKAPIAKVKSGSLQGKWIEKGTLATFKGVPYAQPPVGALRWKAPQPLEKWEGTKKATAFKAGAWQLEVNILPFLEGIINGQGWNALHRFGIKTLLKIAPKPKQSEDCLYLNVTTSSLEKSAKMPVMVWIHGGDHQDGGSAEVFYDGVALPKKEVVLVTINYRLGLMGYFAHPDLTKESPHQVSGNYGTLDQIAALQWVQDNITSFGGDPNNVTIFGESAGGESVAHMLTSPLAKGLFHKAILQSPANAGQMIHLSKSFLHIKSGESRGIEFAKALGKTGNNTIEQLRQLSAKELMTFLRKQEDANTFYPVIDGYVLPKSPFEAFFDKEQANIPILLGSNADEGTCIYPMLGVPISDYQYFDLSEEQLLEQYKSDFNQELFELYPNLAKGDEQAKMDLLGDEMFGSKARWYAEQGAKSGQAIYFYNFRRVPGSSKQTAGAYHAAELPFVHGTNVPILPLSKDDKVLSSKMIEYWTTFAKTGNPNHTNLPKWEIFNPENPKWMILDNGKVGMTTIDRAKKYELLNARTLRLVKGLKEMRDI